MFIEEVCVQPKKDYVCLRVLGYQDTYQFAYFLREFEPYSVLLKVCAAHRALSNLIVIPADKKFRACSRTSRYKVRRRTHCDGEKSRQAKKGLF